MDLGFDIFRFFGKRRPTNQLRNPHLLIDRPDFAEKLEAMSGLSGPLRQAFCDLNANGFAVLKRNISIDLCDRVTEDFARYAKSQEVSHEYRDKDGLYERLANLHLVSPAAAELVTTTSTIMALKALLEDTPKIVGSLYFDKGTEQSIHRDTPAFFTNPLNRYFGVWTALEDVTADSGPLYYFKGGHRVIPDFDLYQENLGEAGYFGKIIAACKAAGLKQESFLAEKGDTLIWHPQLPHGGSTRSNPLKSRRSIVAHYMAASSKIFSPAVFFSADKNLPDFSSPVRSINGIETIDHGTPQFFHNRFEGNFDEF